AGLLSAVVQPDGSLRAADGELLLSPGNARPSRSLSAALRPDPAAGLPPETITGVLAAIGFDDPAAETSVSPDGSWRNGPLRGRAGTYPAPRRGRSRRAPPGANRADRCRAGRTRPGRHPAEPAAGRAGHPDEPDRRAGPVRPPHG